MSICKLDILTLISGFVILTIIFMTKIIFFYPMCASNVFGTTFEISCADAALLAFFWCKVFLFFSFSGFDFDFLKLNIILVEKMGWGLAQSQRNGLRGKNWLFLFFFFFFFWKFFLSLWKCTADEIRYGRRLTWISKLDLS